MIDKESEIIAILVPVKKPEYLYVVTEQGKIYKDVNETYDNIFRKSNFILISDKTNNTYTREDIFKYIHNYKIEQSFFGVESATIEKVGIYDNESGTFLEYNSNNKFIIIDYDPETDIVIPDYTNNNLNLLDDI